MLVNTNEKNHALVCRQGPGTVLKPNSVQNWPNQKPVIKRTQIPTVESKNKNIDTFTRMLIKLKVKQKIHQGTTVAVQNFRKQGQN